MRKSEIKFIVALDKDNIPESISWQATDQEDNKPQFCKAFNISIWDHAVKNSLRIDLWTKEMPVDEMKRFSIDTIGGLAQTILNATGDEYMANELNALCDKFIEHVKKEEEQQGR